MNVCGRFEVWQQTKRRWLQKGAGWSFAASRAAAPRGHQPLQQHAGARPRAPRGTPMPLPRLRLTRESPLEEDSLRLLGKVCALLPQFTLGEFCAVKPPPAHSKDLVQSFSVICRTLHKSQGFRSYERPKLAPKSILKLSIPILNLSGYTSNRYSFMPSVVSLLGSKMVAGA